jgi:2-dehydropantoate 2-reductase
MCLLIAAGRMRRCAWEAVDLRPEPEGMSMRVAVIGAGAMGSLVSILLHESGADVVVYEKREERVAWLRENGVRSRGAVDGGFMPEIGIPGEAAAPYDLLVLAVGARDSGEALRPLSPYVHRDTIYLSLQEGSAVGELAGMVGGDRAFAAMAWVSATESPDGEVEVEGYRSLVLGCELPGNEARISGLAEALQASSPGAVSVTADLDKEIWRRLAAAAAVSAMCAVSGEVPDEARKIEAVDRLCGETSVECVSVAAADGVELTVPGSPWEEAIWRDIPPPLLRDIMAGRKTEAAFLSGYIDARARATGTRGPLNSAAASLLREIESGTRRPGDESVKELARRSEEEKGMSLF